LQKARTQQANLLGYERFGFIIFNFLCEINN